MNRDEMLALADRASKIDPHPFTMYQSSSNDIADCAHAVEELRDILVATLRALAGEKGEGS